MWKQVFIISLTAITAVLAASSESSQYDWKNVEIGGGGFVPGIQFSPVKKDVIYSRNDIGGCYRWNPSTNRWIQLMNWVPPKQWGFTGIESIIPDPVNANRVYALAGMYSNSWDPNNARLLRSDDQGDTWTVQTDLPFKSGGNMPGRGMGERLAVDPNNNQIVYLAARSGNGLWKSTNAGVSWAKVSAFPVTGTFAADPTTDYGKDPIGVLWIKFDPKSGSSGQGSKTIYVAAAETTKQSIYVSKDAGSTWTAVAGQPVGFLPHRGVIGPDGSLIISYSNGAGPYDGTKGDVYKYNPSTGAWTNISPIPSTSSDNYFGYGGLTMDAKNPSVIMVASLNSWWPDNILWRSNNSGATWSRIWEFNGYPDRILKYKLDISSVPWLDFKTNPDPPTPAVKLGWMIESMEIDPFNSDRFMYGTGMTIFGSNDLTKWDSGGQITIVPMIQGQEETAILDLISPPTGPVLHSAVGDICGFTHTDLTKPPATAMLNPTFSSGRSIDYAELKPEVIVRSGDGDNAHIAFSFDSGSTWSGNKGSEPGGVTAGGYVAIAADASSVVWAAGTSGVFTSKNNGASWTATTGLQQGSYIAADRVNPKKFYAFNLGTFYLSTDGGSTFKAGPTLPSTSASSINRPIKAVPGIEGSVFITLGTAGLFKSTDSGATFTKVSSVSACTSIGFGKAATGSSYPVALYIVGTVDSLDAVFRSDDGGSSWTRINDDAHQYGLNAAPITGDLRTFGRVYVGALGIVYGTRSGSVVVTSSSPVIKTTTTTTTIVPTTSTTSSTLKITTTTTTSVKLSSTTTTTVRTTTSTTAQTSPSPTNCQALYLQVY
ncbi:hypothetical protein HK098_002462 [Nowakowskiella sp. JEL0407]|nr:hypothetical protein HK098_002462 [Nowakowskiella sp. JEL0407]